MIETVGWNNIGGAHPNSCRIRINAGDSLADLITAVDTFLTTHGLILYDAAAGTNTRVYQMPLLPDSTAVVGYEYIWVSFNTSGYAILALYESWNSTTHVGTNLATNSNAASTNQRIPANTAGVFNTTGYLQIACSSLLVLFQGFDGANYGSGNDNGPTFVAQLSRASNNDVESTGYSKAVWGNTYELNTAGTQPVCSPRNRVGSGASAHVRVNSVCGFQGAAVTAGTGLMPKVSDVEANGLAASNLWVYGRNSTETVFYMMGTMLDLIIVPREQGIPGVDDVTFTATDNAEQGGAAYVDHDGDVHTWWLVGGTATQFIRLAVRK